MPNLVISFDNSYSFCYLGARITKFGRTQLVAYKNILNNTCVNVLICVRNMPQNRMSNKFAPFYLKSHVISMLNKD